MRKVLEWGKSIVLVRIDGDVRRARPRVVIGWVVVSPVTRPPERVCGQRLAEWLEPSRSRRDVPCITTAWLWLPFRTAADPAV